MTESLFHYFKLFGHNKQKVAVVSSMFFKKDSWFDQYKDEILDNHLAFCHANGFDYFLYNRNILSYSKLQYPDSFRRFFHHNKFGIYGINKLYMVINAKEMGYSDVIVLDTDTKFIEPFVLDYDITANEMTWGEPYDVINGVNNPAIAIAWLINKGFSFNDIYENAKYSVNGGLYHIKTKYMRLPEIEEFCKFAEHFTKLHSNNSLNHAISDETYLLYLSIFHKFEPKFFEQTTEFVWPTKSILNKYGITKNLEPPIFGARNLHFSGNLRNTVMPKFYNRSTANKYDIYPDII